MNEVLERIVADLEKEKITLPTSVIWDLKIGSFITDDNEFMGKLIMVAGRYLVEIERRDREIEKLNKKINDLNKFNSDFCHYYNVPYKDKLAKKNKSMPPAKKFVYEKHVDDLERRGLTDEEICKELGISRSTLWRKRKKWGRVGKRGDSDKLRVQL